MFMKDLIDEAGREILGKKVCQNKMNKYQIEVTKFCVSTKQQEKKLGFESGDYVIINSPLTHFLDRELHDFLSQIFFSHFNFILKKNHIRKKDNVLLVGLGNPQILADCLGIFVLDKIPIKNFDEKNNIFKLAPNVFALTGINSFDIIRLLKTKLSIDYVVVFDSLATENVERLGHSIQINSSGMTPGSALNHFGKKISKKTLGIPCFAVGVPFMLLGSASLKNAFDVILTAKDVHEEVDLLAEIISKGVKKFLF